MAKNLLFIIQLNPSHGRYFVAVARGVQVRTMNNILQIYGNVYIIVFKIAAMIDSSQLRRRV